MKLQQEQNLKTLTTNVFQTKSLCTCVSVIGLLATLREKCSFF